MCSKWCRKHSLPHRANPFHHPSYTGQPLYQVTKPLLVACSALLHWQFHFKSPTFSLGFSFNFPKRFHHAVGINFKLNPPVFPFWCCIPTCRGWTGASRHTADPRRAGNPLSSRGWKQLPALAFDPDCRDTHDFGRGRTVILSF